MQPLSEEVRTGEQPLIALEPLRPDSDRFLKKSKTAVAPGVLTT
jgi:hypothetical protein